MEDVNWDFDKPLPPIQTRWTMDAAPASKREKPYPIPSISINPFRPPKKSRSKPAPKRTQSTSTRLLNMLHLANTTKPDPRLTVSSNMVKVRENHRHMLTFVCSDGKVLANKQILAYRSEYFAGMFSKENGFQESEKKSIHLPHISAGAMQVVVDYIACGDLRVDDLTKETLVEYYTAADYFVEPGLQEELLLLADDLLGEDIEEVSEVLAYASEQFQDSVDFGESLLEHFCHKLFRQAKPWQWDIFQALSVRAMDTALSLVPFYWMVNEDLFCLLLLNWALNLGVTEAVYEGHIREKDAAQYQLNALRYCFDSAFLTSRIAPETLPADIRQHLTFLYPTSIFRPKQQLCREPKLRMPYTTWTAISTIARSALDQLTKHIKMENVHPYFLHLVDYMDLFPEKALRAAQEEQNIAHRKFIAALPRTSCLKSSESKPQPRKTFSMTILRKPTPKKSLSSIYNCTVLRHPLRNLIFKPYREDPGNQVVNGQNITAPYDKAELVYTMVPFPSYGQYSWSFLVEHACTCHSDLWIGLLAGKDLTPEKLRSQSLPLDVNKYAFAISNCAQSHPAVCGGAHEYGAEFTGDGEYIVKVNLDMTARTVSYTINDVTFPTAFANLPDKVYAAVSMRSGAKLLYLHDELL
ncbi:hypothetical protein BZG36_03546 [Bifiguratus adelaidae]|uniref:BTB domain-containing protein n=1 Tax=Bifiguratus adelaidae TaxID=1938954 RepID=A0A261XZC3_9FUNG|nr:hypothetical protein BZG36_03546 [Bifiguratus adelaidae]